MKTDLTTHLLQNITFNLREETSFILGNDNVCFFIMSNKTIKVLSISLLMLLNVLEDEKIFIKINRNVIINTLQFIGIVNSKERLISMKTGNILKVSRQNWGNFK